MTPSMRERLAAARRLAAAGLASRLVSSKPLRIHGGTSLSEQKKHIWNVWAEARRPFEEFVANAKIG